MPKCIITIGIPTSGKSWWAEKQNLPILCCDELRNARNKGKKYIFDPRIEKEIWKEFYTKLAKQTQDFIVCNTNCRIDYINKIKETLNENYEIEYVWFDIPMWKAYYRNIKRWIFENKWIPINVLKVMKLNYDKLKKQWKK